MGGAGGTTWGPVMTWRPVRCGGSRPGSGNKLYESGSRKNVLIQVQNTLKNTINSNCNSLIYFWVSERIIITSPGRAIPFWNSVEHGKVIFSSEISEVWEGPIMIQNFSGVHKLKKSGEGQFLSEIRKVMKGPIMIQNFSYWKSLGKVLFSTEIEKVGGGGNSFLKFSGTWEGHILL